MIGGILEWLLTAFVLAVTLFYVGGMAVITMIRWLRDPVVAWQMVTRTGLVCACFGLTVALAVVRHGDEAAALIVLIGHGVAAVGWNRHESYKERLWRKRWALEELTRLMRGDAPEDRR
jgi:hypothetical protein